MTERIVRCLLLPTRTAVALETRSIFFLHVIVICMCKIGRRKLKKASISVCSVTQRIDHVYPQSDRIAGLPSSFCR